MAKRESTSGISRLLSSLKEQAEINEAEELNSELQSKQSAVPAITAPNNTAVKFTAVKPGAPIGSAVSKNGAAKSYICYKGSNTTERQYSVIVITTHTKKYV